MTGSETPWQSFRGRAPGDVLFGHMFEDSSIEAALFPSGSRVFCIASAGCTALSLARQGCEVTAIDINPAQIALVRARLSGAESIDGAVDRMMGLGRRALRLTGWSTATLRQFLALTDLEEQRTFWRTRLNTRRWRMALTALLSPLALARFYPAPLLQAVPRGFPRIIAGRLDRGFSRHVNASNPYARSLLLGEHSTAGPPVPSAAITLAQADAAEYLERCAPGAFDGFTLSNILDGASPSYAARVSAAVQRAGRPGAVLVLRSLGEPQSRDEDDWASRDRALLWGRIVIRRG